MNPGRDLFCEEVNATVTPMSKRSTGRRSRMPNRAELKESEGGDCTQLAGGSPVIEFAVLAMAEVAEIHGPPRFEVSVRRDPSSWLAGAKADRSSLTMNARATVPVKTLRSEMNLDAIRESLP